MDTTPLSHEESNHSLTKRKNQTLKGSLDNDKKQIHLFLNQISVIYYY